MKFLVSIFALALYFIFAVADTAEEITYAPFQTTVTVTSAGLVTETTLPVASTATAHHQKAGLAF